MIAATRLLSRRRSAVIAAVAVVARRPTLTLPAALRRVPVSRAIVPVPAGRRTAVVGRTVIASASDIDARLHDRGAP